MKKVLITGAGGFVGLHLIDKLKGSYQIIGLTHPSTSKKIEGVQLVNGDILNKSVIEHILKKNLPEIIIHLAGKAASWQTDPEEAFKVNLFGTLNIYQSIINLKEEHNYNPKILYIGSAEVYGKTDHPEKISERSSLNPVNFYGTSKLSADRLSYAYTQSQKLNIVIIRPFNHTGPGQQKGFFIPDMASQIVEIENNPQKNEIIVGNLDSIRDLSDVRDIVEAYKLAIETELKPGEVYNICSSNGIKMSELLKKLLKLAKKEIKVVQDPKRMRASDIPITVGDNSKFISKTGWKLNHTIDQTLADTLEYWRNQR